VGGGFWAVRVPGPVPGPGFSSAGRPVARPDDLVAGSAPRGSAAHFLSVSQLSGVEPGRRYTCSASNPLGKEQAALYFLPPPAPRSGGGASPPLLLLLFLSLGLKLLLLLGTGLWTLQAAGCWGK